MQNRLRSKVAWTSLIALIAFVAKTYFNFELAEQDKLIELILICMTAFGIWNSPTNRNKF